MERGPSGWKVTLGIPFPVKLPAKRNFVSELSVYKWKKTVQLTPFNAQNCEK